MKTLNQHLTEMLTEILKLKPQDLYEPDPLAEQDANLAELRAAMSRRSRRAFRF